MPGVLLGFQLPRSFFPVTSLSKASRRGTAALLSPELSAQYSRLYPQLQVPASLSEKQNSHHLCRQHRGNPHPIETPAPGGVEGGEWSPADPYTVLPPVGNLCPFPLLACFPLQATDSQLSSAKLKERLRPEDRLRSLCREGSWRDCKGELPGQTQRPSILSVWSTLPSRWSPGRAEGLREPWQEGQNSHTPTENGVIA